MLNDILLITVIFLTRIVLPIVVTLVIGSMLDRVLHREARDAQG